MPDATEGEFHPLLTYEDIYGEEIKFGDVLAGTKRELDAFEGQIDAINGFWDFPVSTLLRYCVSGTGCRPRAWRRW